MLKDFSGAERVYIACGYTDLRKGIDGLSILVQQSFELDPFGSSLFLFCGKRNDRIKALYWEGDGVVLLYKRLERGRFQWPRTAEQVQELSAVSLAHGRVGSGAAGSIQAMRQDRARIIQKNALKQALSCILCHAYMV